jgi:formylmethanofuran dehydrogenase subunit E
MPNPPSTIPQADDGGRLERIRRRNEENMRKWHDVHHADPTHSCEFQSKRCRLCDEEIIHTTTHKENTDEQ